MPTLVGILTFMSRINFVLSRVEYEKSFITLGPGIFFIWPYEGLTASKTVFKISVMIRPKLAC